MGLSLVPGCSTRALREARCLKVKRPAYPSQRAKEVRAAQRHHRLFAMKPNRLIVFNSFLLFIYFLDKHINTLKCNLTHGEAAAFSSIFVSLQVFRSPSHARPSEWWRLRRRFTRRVVEPSGPPRSTPNLEGLLLGEPVGVYRQACSGIPLAVGL